ncbi:MAG: sulfotransferase family 2 domain-containing protein [Aquisalimonadaceae bacterium]
MTDLLSPRQPHGKSAAGAAAFLAQEYFLLLGKIQLSRIPLFATPFSRLRDAMVSETLKLVYFPIPKSACTTFATLLALHDAASQDFDPTREGVHGYRFRTGKLQIKDMRCLARDDYFKFTVIRDPYSRLVSAYLDKLIKPRRTVHINSIGCGERLGHGFRMVRSLTLHRTTLEAMDTLLPTPGVGSA